MKTSEIFKVSYGVTLGFLCAKFTFKVGCKIIEKICDVGIDKVERNRKVKYNPYYTKEKKRKYILEDAIDDNFIKVTCDTENSLKELLTRFISDLKTYKYVTVNDLKDFAECKFSSFNEEDSVIGWLTEPTHIDHLHHVIIFDAPIDISDLIMDSKEGDKEDEVEVSE